jgi:hypothetical protein
MEQVKTQQQNTLQAIQVTKYSTGNTSHKNTVQAIQVTNYSTGNTSPKNTIHNNHTYKTQFPREQLIVSHK